VKEKDVYFSQSTPRTETQSTLRKASCVRYVKGRTFSDSVKHAKNCFAYPSHERKRMYML